MQLKNAFSTDWLSIGYRLKVDIIITSLTDRSNVRRSRKTSEKLPPDKP